MKDDGKCADFAIAFTCNVHPELAGYWLWKCGRRVGDGATDRQISKAMKILGYRLRRVNTRARTVRTLARERVYGTFLVTTTDHVVAVVDGRVCDVPEYGDLLRIASVHAVSKIPNYDKK